MPDHRTSIQNALQAFHTRSLREAALDLLDTLGYRSDKVLHLPDATPATFHDFIREHNPEATFSSEKALFDDWISAELLFQLTDSELSGQSVLFDQNRLQPGLLHSYLFFAIERKGGGYPRGKLTALARQINRPDFLADALEKSILTKFMRQNIDIEIVKGLQRTA